MINFKSRLLANNLVNQLNEFIDRCVVLVETFCNWLTGDVTLVGCDTLAQALVICNGLFEAFPCQSLHIRKGDIGQGDSRSAGYGTRDISNCIVEDTVFFIDRARCGSSRGRLFQ